MLLLNNAFSQSLEVKTYYDEKELHLKERYFLISKTDKRLNGDYESFYLNGNPQIKGQYRNHRAIGVWSYYYESGELKMRGEMRNNTNYGLWKYYYENGNLQKEGYLKGDQKEREWVFYYENGQMKSKGQFIEDKKAGEWTYFFEDGSIKAEEFFENGKSQYREFYSNGNIKADGNNQDGKSTGLWIFYDRTDGNVQAKGYYESGLRHGVWKYYFLNGQISSEGSYELGSKIGTWKYYYEDGSLKSEGHEGTEGKEGYWKFYHATGVLKGEAVFKKGDGKYEEYYESGKLKLKGYFSEDQYNGRWEYYFESGKLEGIADYDKGYGFFTGYYQDGAIKMQGEAYNGKKRGLWTLYAPSGDVAGYYRPHQEEDSELLTLLRQEERKKIFQRPEDRPEFFQEKNKSRYFTPRINEYQGLIVGANLLGTLFGELPVAVEYYYQERLGYELQLNYIRSPFFSRHLQNTETTYTNGFSAAIRQKFYHPESNLGVWYFGHETRFRSTNHQKLNPSIPINASQPTVDEFGIEYSPMVGYRLTRDATSPSSLHIDLYLSTGIGYRILNKNQAASDGNYFSLNTNNFYIPIRVGMNIGFSL
ncbi:MAG: toxin-antitoxin system YwqK family antitoxin [Cyclobacteriaceae bacterium]|nr:toxin-antitoxin system YwqK family antitoxin [Cyclobacteriaceae bacterium]MCH8515902.1 toxin-antitoxin system YwqK family antitoxin [Cyclobacteriaceae bacterium]